jgi:phosphatidylglycerophosphatase A
MKMRLVRILTSFFYVGYAPFWPGFFGSAAGLAVIHWTDPSSAAYLCILFSVVGIALCGPSRIAFASDDPSRFVLDEVAGMMLSVLFLPKNIFCFEVGRSHSEPKNSEERGALHLAPAMWVDGRNFVSFFNIPHCAE